MKTIGILAMAGACLWAGAVNGADGAPVEIHCKHFVLGYPLGAPATNDLVIRDLYALSANDTTKFADWIAYRLTPQEIFGELDLEREWRNDPWLAMSETLEAKPSSRDDYRGLSSTDYDRGHLAPLASFKGSRYASQVNFYSNIVPQKRALNQGPWLKLEDKERELVQRYGTIWVMAGPLYERAMPPLPNSDEAHRVPSGFWKIIVLNDAGAIRAAGFILDQETARDARLIDHLESIDIIELRSRLDFFREMPDQQETAIESVRPTAWVSDWVN